MTLWPSTLHLNFDYFVFRHILLKTTFFSPCTLYCHERDRTQTSNRHWRVLTGPDTDLINTSSLSLVLAAAPESQVVSCCLFISTPFRTLLSVLPVVPGLLFGERWGPGCQTVSILKTINNVLTVNVMMNDCILLSTWYLPENIGWILRTLRVYMWPFEKNFAKA